MSTYTTEEIRQAMEATIREEFQYKGQPGKDSASEVFIAFMLQLIANKGK